MALGRAFFWMVLGAVWGALGGFLLGWSHVPPPDDDPLLVVVKADAPFPMWN